MKQIEVQIMGQNYLLGCPADGEARLRDAVERVDGAMCKIRDAGKVKARDRIAVLAALNLAFDLGQLESPPAAGGSVQAPSVQATQPTDASLDDSQASQLIQRLDQALAGDGLLL